MTTGTTTVPELVVRRLAVVAITALGIGGTLLALAIVQPGKVDAATIAAVGVLLNIAAAAAGGLGAILASTRGTTEPTPAPAVVLGDGTGTVTVAASSPRRRTPPAKTTAPRKRTPRRPKT